MSERTTVPGDGAWHQIGTGPATAQLISTGVEVMVQANASSPTGVDGLILISQGENHHFSLAQPIWAQVVQSGVSAILDVQPEAS